MKCTCSAVKLQCKCRVAAQYCSAARNMQRIEVQHSALKCSTVQQGICRNPVPWFCIAQRAQKGKVGELCSETFRIVLIVIWGLHGLSILMKFGYTNTKDKSALLMVLLWCP